MTLDFGAYVATFQTGDDDALLDRFFTEDAVMTTADRRIEGRTALREFLRWAHDGVREIPRPQVVVQDEGHLFAEIDMDFVCTRDRPDFPFQPMKRGEVITVKFVAVYTLRDGRVAHLKTFRWGVGVGVTAAPDYSHILA